jgi:glutamate carboxypeptidase
MVHNPDEEISSQYSKDLLKEIGKKCSRIFVMESSQNDGTGHVFERKGKSNFTIDFYGIAAHAGYIFEHENASAVEEMGYFICEVAKLKDKDKQTSVNIGIAEGGNVVNQVADHARIEFEARYNSIEEKNRIYESVNALIENPHVKGCKAVISDYYETDPWVQSKQGWEYIERVRKIAEDLGMKFEERKRGGLSDANHLSSVCPIIMDGMGPFGSNAHSEKEYMTLSSVEPCVNLFLRILEDLI